MEEEELYLKRPKNTKRLRRLKYLKSDVNFTNETKR